MKNEDQERERDERRSSKRAARVSCSRTAGNKLLQPADETHEIRGSPVELKCAEGERKQISS